MTDLVSLSSDVLQHVLSMCECVEDVGSIACTCYARRNILDDVLRIRAQRAGRVVPDGSTADELARVGQAAARRLTLRNYHEKLTGEGYPASGDASKCPTCGMWEDYICEGMYMCLTCG